MEQQPPPFDINAYQQQARERISEEMLTDRFQREAEQLEQQLGRKLSDRELRGILTDCKADADAGLQPDAWRAAMNVDIPTGGSHEARVQRAMDSLQDAERAETGEQYDPDHKEWAEPASSSPSDQRVARAVNFVNFGISSAEQAEQDAYLQEDDSDLDAS